MSAIPPPEVNIDLAILLIVVLLAVILFVAWRTS